MDSRRPMFRASRRSHMFRSGFLRVLSAGLLCCSTATFVACSATPDGGEQVEQAGTLSLPLTVTVGDHIYRFSYFQLYVYSDGLFLSSTGEPTESVLTAQLPTGRHQARLSYWALQRDDGQGDFLPVNASLVSDPYVEFEILNG